MIRLIVFAAFLWAQDPPDSGKTEIERNAEKLYEEAKKLQEEGKYELAVEKYRELIDRYRSTRIVLENLTDIYDRRYVCGRAFAAQKVKSQGLSKNLHVDAFDLHGFQFNPPDGWRGVPNHKRGFGQDSTSEVRMKAIFNRDKDRVCRYTAPYLEDLHLQVIQVYAPADFSDVETKVLSLHKEKCEGFKEIGRAPLKTRTGIATARSVFTDNAGYRYALYPFYHNKKGFALIGYWSAANVNEGGFTIKINGVEVKTDLKRAPTEEEFNGALALYDQVAKSFMIYDQATRAAMQGKYGMLCRTADWKTHETRGYTIEYNTRDEYAKKLGEHMEKIQALYRRVIPTQKNIPRCHIKLFDTEEDFQYYGQVPGAAAYWSPYQEEIVCYRFAGREVELDSKEKMTVAEGQPPEEVTFNIIYHEGFHQYMYYIMGRDRDVYVPSWLNEGMGDYFFGGIWVKNEGKLSLEIRPNTWRLKTIVEAVEQNKHVPLERILRYTQQQYYANAQLCYAQGWAMNYFFIESEVGKKKGYATFSTRMLQGLKTAGNWEKATDKVFAGVDLKKLEEEWKEFVLSLKKHLPKDVKPPAPGQDPADTDGKKPDGER